MEFGAPVLVTQHANLRILGLHQPFLLLPFRPTSNPSAVRTFVRHFFESYQTLRGESLIQELRMTEPMVGFVPTRKDGWF